MTNRSSTLAEKRNFVTFERDCLTAGYCDIDMH